MATEVAIDGRDWVIDGRPTYEGRSHRGRRIEGLLLNSRMVQAIFDDECAATRSNWAYPDTLRWDPDRNTDEFCAALPLYRRHGLLGVTVGMQGGGAIYRPEVFDHYLNSGFRPDGTLKPAYLDRLARILAAADACGMVVFVNYFYWKQEPRFDDEAAAKRATEALTAWLLGTGHRNILVDLRNEVQPGRGLFAARRIHELLDIARSVTLDGRRLLVSTSTHPVSHRPNGPWPAYCDFLLPHGNDSLAPEWRREMRAFLDDEEIGARARPVCCNEDSIDLDTFEASLDLGISWGYYDQGYGCGQTQTKCDWLAHPREARTEALSGFQTVPVNWGINTAHKRAFFGRLAEVTGATEDLAWTA